MKMIKYDKLVRDGIVDRIKSTWWIEKHHIASDEEFEIKLKNKILEEAKELVEAKDLEIVKKELGDILTVAEEIMKFYNISEEEIKIIKQKKDKEVGKFDKRIILEEASEF